MDHGCTKVQEHVHSHFKPQKHVSHFPGGQYRLIAANGYLDNNAKRPARKDMDTAVCSNRRGSVGLEPRHVRGGKLNFNHHQQCEKT